MKSWLLWLIGVGMVLLPLGSPAQGVAVQPAHGKGTLEVRQVWKAEVTDYSFYVWLTLEGVDQATTIWSPGEMIPQKSKIKKIAFHDITLPDPQELQEGKMTGFEFSFANIEKAGMYTGTQIVRIENEDGEELSSLNLPVQLILEHPAPATLTAETYSWEIAKSTFRDGSVAWLPGKLGSKNVNIGIKNESDIETVTLLANPTVALFRKTDNEPLGPDALLWKGPYTLEPEGDFTVPFAIDRSKMKAGVYEGEIRFEAENAYSHHPVSLIAKLTLTVKSQPIWALIAMLLGLLFAKVLKVIQESQSQIDLVPRLDQVRAAARKLNKHSEKWIAPQLEVLKQKVNSFKGADSTSIDQDFTAIATAIDQLLKVEVLESLVQRLNPREDVAFKARFGTEFQAIRTAVQSGNFPQATSTFTAMNPEFRLGQLNLIVDRLDFYAFAITGVGAESSIQDAFKARFSEDRKKVAIWDVLTADLATMETRYAERSKQLLKDRVKLYRSVADLLKGLGAIPAEKEGDLVKAGKQLLQEIVAADFSQIGHDSLEIQVRSWSEKAFLILSGGTEMSDADTRESMPGEEDPVTEEPSRAGEFSTGGLTFQAYQQAQLTGWEKWISLLTYVTPGQARLKYWASFVLIVLGYVGLLITGLQIFYIEDTDALGAGGPLDFLPLFLWGLTVDVTNQTLAKLTQVKDAGKVGPA